MLLFWTGSLRQVPAFLTPLFVKSSVNSAAADASKAVNQSSGGAGTESSSSGRNPYEAASDEGGYGSVGGGIGGRSGGAPENPAVFEAPDDIPSGNDDDIVARQLREAAMREADPEVREALWNEYRKYKGIEIPE